MSIQKAEKELQAKQGALDKLTNEKNKLTQSLDELQKKRSVATRDLAAGDESQQEVIFTLEGQIAPILLRLEGIETLISEAEAKVQSAKAALGVAKADYEKELFKFIEMREKEELGKLRADVPERRKQLCERYASLCQDLGQLQVDSYSYSTDGQQVQEILEITTRYLSENLRDTLKAKSLRPLMVRGSHIDISIWSHFPIDPDIASTFPGIGPINALDVAKVMRSRRISVYEKEFEAKHKD